MSKNELIKLCLLHINHSYHEIKIMKNTISEAQLLSIVTNLILDLKHDQEKIAESIDCEG